MKIRNGFVSNSSSSSFVLYGAYLTHSEIDKAYKALQVIKGAVKTQQQQDDEDEDDLGYYDMANEIARHLGLHFESADDEYYIGREWTSIGDNETGGEFKGSIEAALQELFPGIKTTTHEVTSYS